MIRRLYVDNFRSLVDFTWEPGKETLVLGYNGSGKTSALEVFEILQRICADTGRLDYEVLYQDKTSWAKKPDINFEVDVSVQDDLYSYRFTVSFDLFDYRPSIASETLYLNGAQLFIRTGQRVQMILPDEEKGAYFPISTSESVVSVIGDDLGGERITPFRDYFSRLLYLKPLPFVMGAAQSGPLRSPESSLAYVVPWYLYLIQKDDFEQTLGELLRDVWPDFLDIQTPERAGGTYDLVLRVRDDSAGRDHEVPMRTMSDGERMLLGLYIVAAYQRTHPPTTIIIDEPDNHVSLLELQPWLLTMLDDRPDDGQIILVSHNPDLIRTMSVERTIYFSRQDHLSPTKVRKIERDEAGTPLVDRFRRGWMDE